MFDEMPHDQFYQFLAAAASRAAVVTTNTTTTTPLPITFSLHHNSNHHHDGSSYPTSFDLSTYSLSPPQPHPQPQQQGFISPPPHLLHHTHLPLHLQPNKIEVKEPSIGPPPGLDRIDPNWSNDEVLALLRIRSTMDNNWFPDFTWENVSRKLGELGFKRSAEKCKEKFEEETRSFNSSIINTTNTATATNNNSSNNNNNDNNSNCSGKNVSPSSNSYRLFGELEELCNNSNKHHDHQQSSTQEEYDQPQTITSEKEESQEKQNADDNDQVEGDKPMEEREKDEGEMDGEKEDEGKGNDDNNVGDEHSLDDSEKTEETSKRVMRKRKREKKFEMFKGFCESIVSKMMAQQEQLHAKILQDMVKRDEEKIAREEAWKREEIERVKKEMEVRAHEQAIAGDRQAKILAFLKKFASSNAVECQSLREAIENLLKVQNASSNSLIMTQECIVGGQPTTSSCATHDQNPSSMVAQKCASITTTSSNENLGSDILNRVDNSKSAPPISSTSSIELVSRNPNAFVSAHKSSVSSNHTSSDGTGRVTNLSSSDIKISPKPNVEKAFADDTGRRWPRDEVLALINIRSSLFNSNGEPHHDRESSVKGPLWERISQKMLELGYQRSAKRCKEKWENINKYFRKTKDLNKKRSVDSRTCPYFHQLSHLYNQASLVGSPENKSMALPSAQGEAGETAGGAPTTLHGCQGNGNEGVVQIPTCDFDV